jgi:hypothetical protein
MTTYTSPFTGNVIQPTDVSYAGVALTGTLQLYWPQYVNADEQVAARIMDIQATAGSILVLPDATQASVGQDILIRNTGANAFTVQRFGGTGSFTVAAGTAQYTYITGGRVGRYSVWNGHVYSRRRLTRWGQHGGPSRQTRVCFHYQRVRFSTHN